MLGYHEFCLCDCFVFLNTRLQHWLLEACIKIRILGNLWLHLKVILNGLEVLLYFLLKKDIVLGFEFVEAGLEHGFHVVDLLP